MSGIQRLTDEQRKANKKVLSKKYEQSHPSRMKKRYADPVKRERILERNRYYSQKNRLAIRQRRRDAQRQHKLFVVGYLATHPCIDCGETDPIVLEFDHRNPNEKKDAIAHMVSTLVPLASLEAEIGKCDVRCANCHRRKTAKQLGWQKTPC